MYKLSDNIGVDYLDDGNVLVDFNSGKFFGVNEVSALILINITKGKNEIEIADIIAKKYNIDVQTATDDLKELISELLSLQILVKV